MKKLLFALILAVAVLSGCSGKGRGVTAVTENIEFTAQIDYYGTNYTYSVKIPESGRIIMETVYPENIKGAVLDFNGTDAVSRYNGLEVTENISDIITSPAGFIYSVFSDAGGKKEQVQFKADELYIASKKYPYDYRLYVGDTGLPVKITDNSGLTAVISWASIYRPDDTEKQ